MKGEIKPENLEWISIKADYNIKNLPCCKPEFDLWFNHEKDSDFKFCPFCGRVIRRTIYIPNYSMIGWKNRTKTNKEEK